MEIVDPREFTSKLFREDDFREKVRQFNWAQYKDKPVLIQGCGSVILPTWVFLVITAELAPFAKSISYGETARPIPVMGKLGSGTVAR